MLPALLFGALAACGCDSSPSVAPASVALTADGAGAEAADVQASDDASRVALHRVFVVPADGTAMKFTLPPGEWLLRVELFSDAARLRSLGAGTVRVVVRAGVGTEIRAQLHTDAGVDKVDLVADHVPVIERVDVAFGAPPPGGVLAARNAAIHVTASDLDGDGLRFFWSGLGLDGVVEGGPDFTILAAQAKLGPPIVFIVVRDPAGATAIAKVAFVPVRDCLLCGDYQVSILGDPDRDACLEAHVNCVGR
jgi:hypothetical protein